MASIIAIITICGMCMFGAYCYRNNDTHECDEYMFEVESIERNFKHTQI